MLRKKTDLYTKRTVLLCLLLLLGIASLCGCGKKEPVASPTPTLAPTATPTPTPTATPTPTPTPTPPFVERAYENFGRDDIYKIPIEEFTGNWEIMSSRFNGDYALLWITEMSFEAEKELEPDKCILIKPLVDDEQYRITPGFYIRDMALLDDGTVLLADCDSPKIHIYDNKLNEIRTVLPGEKGDARSIGFSTNGMIWTADEKKFKLEATDLNGDIVGLYEYDPGIQVTNYVGSVDGRECFEAVSNDGEYIHSYIYLDTEKKEVTYRDGYDRELGEEWQINDVPCVYGTSVFNHSDSTWFIHKPGYPWEGVVFPKESVREEIAFYRDGILCGRYSGYSDTDEYILEYRMYDLKNRTFSDTVRRSDFSGCSDIRAEGFVGDDTVVLLTSHENGNKDLLLWITEKGNTPIKYFCDLSKDDLAKCLEQEIKDLKEKYDIVVTPDCTGSERLSASLGDIMSGMDFVNLFMNDKAFTEEFKPEQGRTIHPENMRNNDGAHFTFNPHVFSSFYLLEHGEERRNVFFGYVDALRAGEDRFKCPDEDTANWCGIRLAKYFFPIGYVYASTEYAGGGWANIVYRIPKEEFLEKEREFEDRICEILNDVLEDDYTDFEKTLALYEFITEYCTYDYEMLDHLVEWSDKQSGYRVLEEKKGICWEIACLYRYLLLQCGVDSEESVGVPFDVTEEYHEWNYIAFDGKGYLIDATWGLTADRRPNLAYFMFTDEMRETRDGFDTKSFDIGGNGLYGARKKYSFEAVDMKYSDLWEGTYIAFDQDEKCIFYRAMSGRVKRFYYEK